MASLLIVIVAACLFGLIAYRDRGEANATNTQRVGVFMFEVVVATVILSQSPASWPLKIAIFVVLQVMTAGLLAGVKRFYEGD